MMDKTSKHSIGSTFPHKKKKKDFTQRYEWETNNLYFLDLSLQQHIQETGRRQNAINCQDAHCILYP